MNRPVPAESLANPASTRGGAHGVTRQRGAQAQQRAPTTRAISGQGGRRKELRDGSTVDVQGRHEKKAPIPMATEPCDATAANALLPSRVAHGGRSRPPSSLPLSPSSSCWMTSVYCLGARVVVWVGVRLRVRARRVFSVRAGRGGSCTVASRECQSWPRAGLAGW